MQEKLENAFDECAFVDLQHLDSMELSQYVLWAILFHKEFSAKLHVVKLLPDLLNLQELKPHQTQKNLDYQIVTIYRHNSNYYFLMTWANFRGIIH